MNLTEYSSYDATGLAKLVRANQIQAHELAALAQLATARINPLINAVIEIYPERIDGPHTEILNNAMFAGVPLMLKDTGASERGKKQQCGSRIGQGYIAQHDSNLTTQYKSAGFNIVGRTAMPEFSQAATTESNLYGNTANPWDLRRSTGGSSGGAAAAVAAGILPVAHGTDTGGSIRIPAACCGLVGLKPSRGRISKGPSLDETLYAGLNTEHVLTRSVRDTAGVLDATSQPCVGDPEIIVQSNDTFRKACSTAPRPLRIAFETITPFGNQVDTEIQTAVKSIALQCEAMGHQVYQAMPLVDAEPYGMADKIVWAYSTLQEVRRVAAVTGRPINSDNLETPTLEACNFASELALDDWFTAMSVYNDTRRKIGRFFCDYDLLLTPTVTTVAPPLGHINSNRDIKFDSFMQITGDFCPYTALFNVTGQPAISLPLCTSQSGLPIGIQFVSKFGDESTLLSIAAAFERAMPWHDRQPAIHASCSNKTT